MCGGVHATRIYGRGPKKDAGMEDILIQRVKAIRIQLGIQSQDAALESGAGTQSSPNKGRKRARIKGSVQESVRDADFSGVWPCRCQAARRRRRCGNVGTPRLMRVSPGNGPVWD